MTRDELENRMAVLLGGRAAERLIFGELSTGAADDLAKATDIARNMVTRFGMNEKLGQVALDEPPQTFLGIQPPRMDCNRAYSEQTAREVDLAVRDLVDRAFNRATAILQERRSTLQSIAKKLLEKETLSGAELKALLEQERWVPSPRALDAGQRKLAWTAPQ
jgi:cell division protease FtsH